MIAHLLVLVLLASKPVYAVDLPRFDVDAPCATQAHGDDHARKLCIRSEQYNYDLLKLVWPMVSEKTQAVCLRAAHFAAYHYSTVTKCVLALLPDQHLDEPVDQQGPFRY